VFTLVNLAVIVLRARPVGHDHFRAPLILPILGMISCAYLASPWAGRSVRQYKIAGVLLLIGLVLYAINWFVHGRRTQPLDAEKLAKG
jgi:hypothetical protein